MLNDIRNCASVQDVIYVFVLDEPILDLIKIKCVMHKVDRGQNVLESDRQVDRQSMAFAHLHVNTPSGAVMHSNNIFHSCSALCMVSDNNCLSVLV